MTKPPIPYKYGSGINEKRCLKKSKIASIA